MKEQSLSVHFIEEPIEALYDQPQIRTKNPGCPDAIRWRSSEFRIVKILKQWSDFSRKGKIRKNMRDAHRDRAEITGSWGVGRIFFRIKVDSGQEFEIYYDRAPKNISDRGGIWFLFKEYT